jgi:hypothetical protein
LDFVVTGINVKVDLFYSMLFYLMDTFVPKRLVRVRVGDDICGVRNWLDDRVEVAIRERNDSYDVWSNNVNRVRGDRLWVDYIAKRRHADARYGASGVLPIPKVAFHVKFSDYRPISLLACLSKVFVVLMARQMEAHIRRNELLTVFQSGVSRHHSTTAAVLKVTEDI